VTRYPLAIASRASKSAPSHRRQRTVPIRRPPSGSALSDPPNLERRAPPVPTIAFVARRLASEDSFGGDEAVSRASAPSAGVESAACPPSSCASSLRARTSPRP
jgi:hypothetical protein